MMSSNLGKSEPVLNIKNLFYESPLHLVKDNKKEQKTEISINDNFLILKEFESILHNCPTLTNKQRLDYCISQRYFMKAYLREINKV